LNEQDLHFSSAKKLISLILDKEITIHELTQSYIDHIEKIDSNIDAWVSLNKNQSLTVAEKLDQKFMNGENIGPLFGIPIGIKDIFNTEDFPCQMGSQLWKNFTPGNDARVVSDLRMANAIILGKTETAEFAVHALGNTKNPFDKNRSPGTSSSGSAVAVATGMVPFALGTQTAGSIIRPASYCGVYGFKPSFGLIPRTGMLKTTDTLDQVGYFTRTPEDLELFFDLLHVKGKNYPYSNAALTDEKRQNIVNRPWKIKFVKTSVWDNAENYAKKEIEKFCTKLNQFDEFDVNEEILSDEFISAHENHEIIYAKSLSYYFEDELKNKSLISEIFYDLAIKSKNISMDKFDFALNYQNNISKKLDQMFNDFDILISLSTAGCAPLKKEKEIDDPSLIWTMCGVPAINIPAFNYNGLPFGVQIVSRKYNDLLLLRFVNLLHSKEIIHNTPNPNLK